MFINGSGGDWLGFLKAHEGEWGTGGDKPCGTQQSWPPGWGGTITDSCLQDPDGGHIYEHGVFAQSIQVSDPADDYGSGQNYLMNRDKKLVAVPDPVQYIIVREDFSNHRLGQLAYPDMCTIECPGCWCCAGGLLDDGDEGCYGWHTSWDMLADRTLLNPYTRHLGGVNIGYLDGHAAWTQAQALIAKHAESTNNMGGWSPEMGVEAWFVTALDPDDAGYTLY